MIKLYRSRFGRGISSFVVHTKEKTFRELFSGRKTYKLQKQRELWGEINLYELSHMEVNELTNFEYLQLKDQENARKKSIKSFIERY